MNIFTPFAPSKQKGFTLVEMLVAVAIFSVVMIIAVGSLVSIIDANRKARTQKTVLNNLNATLETMSRNIREGNNYMIVSPSHFSFTDVKGRSVEYRLVGGLINRRIDGGTMSPITADEVQVDQLQFEWITNSDITDPVRKVLVTVRGTVGPSTDRASSEFNIQSLVSQRYRPSVGGAPLVISEVAPNIVCPFQPAPGRVIVNLAEVRTNDNILRQCSVVPANFPTCKTEITFDLGPGEEVPPGTYDVKLAAYDDHCGNGYHQLPGPFPAGGYKRFPRASDGSHPIESQIIPGLVNYPAYTIDGLSYYHPNNPPDGPQPEGFVQNDPSEPGGLEFECHDPSDACTGSYCQAHEQYYIEAYDTDISVLAPLFTSGNTRDIPYTVNVALPPDDVGTVTVNPGEKINRVKALHAIPLNDPTASSRVNSLMPSCVAFDDVGGVSPINVNITPF